MAFVQSILFPYDFSPAADRAASFVRDVAVRAGGRVTVLAVTAPGQQKEDVARALGAALHRELHDVAVSRVVETGDPAAKITEYAVRLGASLIMMPTHGHDLSHDLLIGSVTARVMLEAPCPVWTAHLVNGLHPGAERILCVEDNAEDHLNACDWARGFGAAIGAAVIPVRTASDNVAGAVAAESRDAAAIVIGRGPARGRTERLRSHVYALVNNAKCPVIGV